MSCPVTENTIAGYFHLDNYFIYPFHRSLTASRPYLTWAENDVILVFLSAQKSNSTQALKLKLDLISLTYSTCHLMHSLHLSFHSPSKTQKMPLKYLSDGVKMCRCPFCILKLHRPSEHLKPLRRQSYMWMSSALVHAWPRHPCYEYGVFSQYFQAVSPRMAVKPVPKGGCWLFFTDHYTAIFHIKT